jgi:hypothetical protein
VISALGSADVRYPGNASVTIAALALRLSDTLTYGIRFSRGPRRPVTAQDFRQLLANRIRRSKTAVFAWITAARTASRAAHFLAEMM